MDEHEMYHRRHFPEVGDVVLIEVRRTFKSFEIIANFGQQEVRQDEETRLRDEVLAVRARELADDIMPYSNVVVAVVMGSTCPQEPVASFSSSAVFLSQSRGTGELDIVDVSEVEVIYGTKRDIRSYMDEVSGQLQSGLQYNYYLAQVLAVAESIHRMPEQNPSGSKKPFVPPRLSGVMERHCLD